MRLTLTVELEPDERVAGQPESAAVMLRPGWDVTDLLNAAGVEAADAQLPPQWRDCVAAMVAVRVLAAGLRAGVPVVTGESTVHRSPVRLRPLGV